MNNLYYVISLTAEIISIVHVMSFFKVTLWCFSTEFRISATQHLCCIGKNDHSPPQTKCPATAPVCRAPRMFDLVQVRCGCCCLWRTVSPWCSYCFETDNSCEVCTCKLEDSCLNCVLLNNFFFSAGFQCLRPQNNPTVNSCPTACVLLLRMTIFLHFHSYSRTHS